MDELITRVWSDIFGRINGPGHFRLLMQPAVAIFLAIQSGRKDARVGRPPFLWGLLFDREHRHYFLVHGWKDICKLFFMAAIMDIIFQVAVFKDVYPLETLMIAVSLSLLPYVLVRGPVNRLIRMILPSKSDS